MKKNTKRASSLAKYNLKVEELIKPTDKKGWPYELEPNFTIITCRDCYKHKWNTRHNQDRYLG